MKKLLETLANHKLMVGSLIYGIVSFIIILNFLSDGSSLSSLIIASIMAIIPVPVYVFLVLRRDEEPEPFKWLAFTFVWGATIAIALSMIFNNISDSVFGLSDASSAIIMAPLIEEFFKGVAVLSVFLFFKKTTYGIRDAIVYASMVGLGFAMTENVIYYMSSIVYGGFNEALSVFMARGWASFNAHAIFTSLTAIGLSLAGSSNHLTLQKVYGFGGFLCAVLMHMAWNASATFGNEWFFMMWALVYIPSLLFVAYYRENKG